MVGIGYQAHVGITYNGKNITDDRSASSLTQTPMGSFLRHTESSGSYYMDTISQSIANYDSSGAMHHDIHALAYVNNGGTVCSPASSNASLQIQKSIDITSAMAGMSPSGTLVNAGGQAALTGVMQLMRDDTPVSAEGLYSKLTLLIELSKSSGTTTIFNGYIELTGTGLLGDSNWCQIILGGDMDTASIRNIINGASQMDSVFAVIPLSGVTLNFALPVNIDETFGLNVTLTADVYAPAAAGVGAEIATGNTVPVLFDGYVPNQADASAYAQNSTVPEPATMLILAAGGFLMARSRARRS